MHLKDPTKLKQSMNIYCHNACSSKGKKVKVKVKQSHYRPGEALRVPGG